MVNLPFLFCYILSITQINKVKSGIKTPKVYLLILVGVHSGLGGIF